MSTDAEQHRATLRHRLSVSLVFLVLFSTGLHAQDPVYTGLQSSFDIPIGELLEKKHDSEVRNLFNGLSLGVAYNYPASRAVARVGEGDEGDRQAGVPTVALTWKYTPLGYWFIGGSFVGYQDVDRQQPWNPDFTYCFGYNDWHPYTFSLSYCNYGGNRLLPEDDQKRTDFDAGGWTLGYKFPVPQKIQDLLLIDPDGSIGCNVGYTYVRKFTDAQTNSDRFNKQKLSFGCKYTIWKWWYWNFAMNYYPDKSQQQPWDPDFTYGFGYFDWHPGTISVQYNNYSGNRWNSNDLSEGTGRFKNGSFSVSYSRSF